MLTGNRLDLPDLRVSMEDRIMIRLKSTGIASLFGLVLLIGAGNITAAPSTGLPGRPVVVERKVVIDRPAPVRKATSLRVVRSLASLPIGHTRIIHGGKTYYVHDGIYYSRLAGGYVVVRPVAGIRINSLPRGVTTVRVDGRTLYRYRDVTYRKSGSVFVVV